MNDLKTGDYALTNFHGREQRVKLMARLETPHSQSGYSFYVQTLGEGRAMPSTYDAAWFWKPTEGKTASEVTK